MIRVKCQEFAKILFSAYDDEAVTKHKEIDWAALQTEVTVEMIENLYQLSNDSQRVGYLSSIFNSFFTDGVSHWLEEVDGNLDETDLGDAAIYTINCCRVLNGVIYDVANAALYYPNLAFSEVARNSNMPKDFIYCIPAIKVGFERDEKDIQEDSAMEDFKARLNKYDFYNLPKVKDLDDERQNSLLQLLKSNKKQAYKIAMYDFLGFLRTMEKKIPDIKVRNKLLAELLGFPERAVRGCISGLYDKTGEESRYHSFEHKKEVKSDYDLL